MTLPFLICKPPYIKYLLLFCCWLQSRNVVTFVNKIVENQVLCYYFLFISNMFYQELTTRTLSIIIIILLITSNFLYHGHLPRVGVSWKLSPGPLHRLQFSRTRRLN